MATATTVLSSYERADPMSGMNFRSFDDSFLSRGPRNFFMTQMSAVPVRPNHYLDELSKEERRSSDYLDMDILMMKRQYDKINLFERGRLSNSAEDLSELDRIPYPFEMFDGDPDDMEEDDYSYEESGAYDYAIAIQERLKLANEQFENDRTSGDFKQAQRVSFVNVVKAVDIVQHPSEHDQTDPFDQSTTVQIDEDLSNNENERREYDVPLNDLQPKEKPSLLEQLKAIQFHGQPIEFKETETNQISKTMLVAVNGQFDLKNLDDYTAKSSTIDENREKSIPKPRPPKTEKKNFVPIRHSIKIEENRPENVRRIHSASTPAKTANSTSNRPKSAIVSTNSTSAVDFNELLRKGAEKRRLEMKEERRKREEAEEKRQKELEQASEAFKHWLADKEAARRRIKEQRQAEKAEEEAQKLENERKLNELRQVKFQQWIDRKNHEANLSKAFEQLKENERLASEGSSNSSQNGDRRAFQRWLRKKYEQSLEEKRRVRQENKRRRRSLKRHQLQLDLQLARSYGYT